MKRLLKAACALFVILGMATACVKQNKMPVSVLSVRLQDYPGKGSLYEKVNLDIGLLQVSYESGRPGWTNLDTRIGVYDLLKLQQGRSVYLVKGDVVPQGKITSLQIRLGTQNTIQSGGITYPLMVDPHDQEGLTIPIAVSIGERDNVDILIGIDVAASVVDDGNNRYRLDPSFQVLSVEHASHFPKK